MSKRAIILGGAGLIGSHLCLRLLSEGYEVISIDKRGRRESPILRNIESVGRFNHIKHDITSAPYNIGCDELYNLTSPTAYSGATISHNYLEEQRLTALGSLNSLNILVGSKTKVLYGSSQDVYNFNDQKVSYDSEKQFIAEAKRFGESLHKAYHAHHNIDMRIARIFSTYGTNAGLRDQYIIGRMIVEALHNREIVISGDGREVGSFCWVDDIVSGITSLMRAHNSEGLITADLASPHKISINELAELIISLTGSSSKIHHTETKTDDTIIAQANTLSTLRSIGWEAKTPLKEGLLRTINYIEKELSAIAMSQMSWVEIYG